MNLVAMDSRNDWLVRRFGLEGRTALVTGGGSGIGEALACALGLGGARLVIVGRRNMILEQAIDRFKKAGIAADGVQGDLLEEEGINKCVEAVINKVGHIDILVNAAGFNLRKPFMEVNLKTWNQHLAIHLTAPFVLVQRLAPRMKEQKWGRIINVASLQSARAFRDSAPYGAGKGGIVQLTRAIAEHWSPHGITCNAIAPGFFRTTLTEEIFADPKQVALQSEKTMIGRNGELEDLHGAALFLASDASAYITGQTLYVDGGYSAK